MNKTITVEVKRRPILTLNGPRPRVEPVPALQPATPKRPHPKKDMEAFATTFVGVDPINPMPLAIGSHTEILAQCAAQLGWSKKRTRAALGFYAGRPSYLWATLEATHRINLDGSEAQPISDADRAYAKARIAAFNGKGRDQ
ncbi:ProQ/FINO family protein [Celeribacter marinus]|uniref:ProQ/FINO family protein n=1 Tax=Celeribacter marinus TaxID=1397108 RepID=UPI00317DA42B